MTELKVERPEMYDHRGVSNVKPGETAQAVRYICALESELASLRADRDRLREALNHYAIEGNGSEMWSRCRICKELSRFDPTTAREIFTHKSDCLLAQETTK